MKLLKLTALSVLITCIVISCKKDSDDGGGSAGGGKLVRIHQGQDPLTDDDTVYLITYNAAGKIEKLIDSIYEDTMKATYNAAGKIERITNTYGEQVKYTYDAAGLVTQQDYNWGTNERYMFTYNNGVIEKKSYYHNANGPMELWRYWTYTLTNGNITSIKEYNKSGTLLGETTLTYTTLPNEYKELALFNYGNNKGFDPFITDESLFNKNVVATMTANGQKFTLTNTLNGSQQLQKMVVTDNLYDDTYTWRFNYK
jgi:YD repeat-containing protein